MEGSLDMKSWLEGSGFDIKYEAVYYHSINMFTPGIILVAPSFLKKYH